MEISYKTVDNGVYAYLKGEFDEYTAEYVRVSLDELLKDLTVNPNSSLILDFSKVSFMDSTGIGVLLGRYNKFVKNNIQISIQNATGHIDRILKMTGIYSIIPKIS